MSPSRLFFPSLILMLLLAGVRACLCAEAPRPNVVVIFADDLGYGDLGCFGHPTIATPNLDRLAAEGQRWTSFYAAASVCTPSRAGLMTGRLPIRSGMCSSKRRVLFPDSKGGLQESELTLAELLKQAGYATACIGKWHLGHLPPYLPTNHGFDSYFGIPYSNDMDRVATVGTPRETVMNPKSEYFNVPLVRNEEIVERPARQETLTRRYTEEAVRFIREHRDGPFFLYLAHSMPHVPLFRSLDFENKSLRGRFGDVIEEIDWSVGRVAETLRELGIAENTLVVFTSDNGPWLVYNEQGGSAGLLREGKGTTWEGDMREPTVFWWPGTIKPAVVRGVGSTLDLLPTCAALAGEALPDDRTFDGVDLSGTLLRGEESPRTTMFYYRGTELFAIRHGAYKAHLQTRPAYVSGEKTTRHENPLLFNLDVDPSEKYDIAGAHPEVVAEIAGIAEEHRKTVLPVESQLER